MIRKFDNYSENFNKFEDFIACIEDREGTTERLTVPAKSVKFLPILPEDVKEVAEELGVEEALVEDTIRKNNEDYGTCLVLKKGKHKYLVGSSTFLSGEQRIRLFGKGVWDLTNFPKTLARAFTELFSLKENSVKIVVIDDKVRAIMSHLYAFVPMKDVFTRVVKEMSDRFECDFKVEEAYIDHSMATLKILFPMGGNKLVDLYRLPQNDGWKPGLTITTSDTGDHAVKIDPYFQNGKGGKVVLTREDVRKKHIGDLSVEKILDELPNIFLKYQDAVDKMIKLLSIQISNPVTVIKKAAKELNYTKKAQEGMVDEMKYFMAMASDPVTAYDCYQILCDYAKYVEGTPQTKLLAQEMAGKAINIKYEKLD